MIDLNKRDLVDLTKAVKRGIREQNLNGLEANVIVVMDRSGSMQNMWPGVVNALFLRTLALALAVDTDGKVPCFIFHDTVVRAPDITAVNVDSYVASLAGYSWGGTNYAPPLKLIQDETRLKGFFSKTPAEKPTVVLYFTDGDNTDKRETEKVIREMADECPVFIKFFTIGNLPFPFLEGMDDMKGRRFDNVDVKKFKMDMTEEELVKAFLDELPKAFQDMKRLGMIK